MESRVVRVFKKSDVEMNNEDFLFSDVVCGVFVKCFGKLLTGCCCLSIFLCNVGKIYIFFVVFFSFLRIIVVGFIGFKI